MKDIVKVSEIHDSITIQDSTKPENLMNRFFEFLDVSEQSTRTYKHGIMQFMKYLNRENISKPVRENVIAYKREMQSKGLKPSTIALYLSSIRRFFAWSASEGLYANITDGVKSPKQPAGHKRDYLSGAQVAYMLENVESKRDYAMIVLLTTCGLRTVEVIRANVEDIRTLGDVRVLYVQGKGRTDKSEFVQLSEPVYKALQEYLQTRGQVKPNEPLFVSESRRNAGSRLTTRTVSRICKRSMQAAGYDSPRLTAHSLRHSAATLALLSGVELTDVSAFMRHSSVSTTMIYAHNVNRLKSLCELSVTSAIFGAERKSA